MSRASPTVIGAFVVGAVTLVIAGLLIFGGGAFFKDSDTYVVYFGDAITGLNPGAPVVLGGVKVGEVTEVKAVVDQDLKIAIPVLIKIGGGKIEPRGDPNLVPDREQAVPILIKRGLRAQLGMQSLVTGQLLIALVFKPAEEAVFRGDGRVPEIPTIESSLTQVQRRLSELPLQQIAAEALNVLKSIDRFISSDELAASVGNLNRTLVSVRGLSDNLDSRIEPLAESADDALATLAEDSSTRYALDDALVELAAAARSIRILAEYLERHPEALIVGKKQGGN